MNRINKLILSGILGLILIGDRPARAQVGPASGDSETSRLEEPLISSKRHDQTMYFSLAELEAFIEPVEAIEVDNLMTRQVILEAFESLVSLLEGHPVGVKEEEVIDYLGSPHLSEDLDFGKALTYFATDLPNWYVLRITFTASNEGDLFLEEAELDYRSPQMFMPLALELSDLDRLAQTDDLYANLEELLGPPEKTRYRPASQELVYSWFVTGTEESLAQVPDEEVTIIELASRKGEIYDLSYATKADEVIHTENQ